MKELGNYLKNIRISNSVSLTEASEDLNLSSTLLENIESGNSRAFKDIYEMKKDISKYAKYLGADVDKVVDSFNDYLFEKTSKINLEDIKALKESKEKEDNTKKVISPYTIIPKKKINFIPILIGLGIIILLLLILYIIYINVNKETPRVEELIIINERI